MFDEIFGESTLRFIEKVGFAALCGGLIGFEREYHHKDAGLRTTILICIGAALFSSLSPALGFEDSNRTRIAAQVVTGIGFIGAGAIIRTGASVTGLTTAATMWVVGAVGLWIGFERYSEALVATACTLATLTSLSVVERLLDLGSDVVPLAIEIDDDREAVIEIRRVFRYRQVQLRNERVIPREDGALLKGEFTADKQTRRKVEKDLRSLGAKGVRRIRDSIL